MEGMTRGKRKGGRGGGGERGRGEEKVKTE